MGPKGQLLIPKRSGIGRGSGRGIVTINLTESGVLVRGKPSADEVIQRLDAHAGRLAELGIRGSKPGELKGIYLELEFEEEK